MGVVTESKSTDPDAYWALPYVIPSAIMNVLCVVLLIYLVATIKGKSNLYKLAVAFFLIIGLVAEVYMTMLLDMTNKGQEAGTWIVIILNWLFRAFYVLEFVQEEWTPLFPAAKEAVKAASSSSSSSSSDFKAELRKKLDEYVNRLRDKIKSDDKKDSSGKLLKVWTRKADEFIKDKATSVSDFGKVKDLVELSDSSKAMSYMSGGRR